MHSRFRWRDRHLHLNALSETMPRIMWYSHIIALSAGVIASVVAPTGALAQTHEAFTVAARDENELISYEFFCDHNGQKLECAAARGRLARKLTAEEADKSIAAMSDEELTKTRLFYTSNGGLCSQRLSNGDIVKSTLGMYGGTLTPADADAYAHAWSQMCGDTSLDTIRSFFRARADLDMKSCTVSSQAEKVTFTWNQGRWMNMETLGGICPGSVILETLEQKAPQIWVYSRTENVNGASSPLCTQAAAKSKPPETYTFGEWARPAPFSCQTIEFATY